MRNRPDALMLFAAGFGTRMAPLTLDRPKPLVEVGGRALIDHALDIARQARIGRIVANLHYLPDLLQDHLAGTGVVTVTETPEILDTGGGLRNALPHLGGGAVLTMNTDAVWTGPNPLTTLLDAWDPRRMDALLLLVPGGAALGHAGTGDFVLSSDGRVARGPGHVYSGAQIVKTETLEGIETPVFSLNRVWDRIGAQARLFGTVHPGGWCDVGRPESIALAEDMLGTAGV